MKKIFISLFLIITASCTNATESFAQVFPKKSELLFNPAPLKNCQGISIIEWKETISSSLSKEDKSFYNRLNTICKVTKSNFIKLLKINMIIL